MNILWDVDGTLIANDRLHVNLYRDAVRAIFDITVDIDELSHDSKTDRQIILEYIASTGNDSGRENEVSQWLDIRSSKFYVDPLSARKELAGAKNALRIMDDLGHTNLLMTGNSRERSRAKLVGAGFDLDLFDWDISAFGTYFAKRTDLAAHLASTINGGVVVGDTPGDGNAARFGHFSFIGVTTGSFSREDLSEFNPVVVLDNLELEIDDFIKAIQGLNQDF